MPGLWTPQREIITPWPGIIVPKRSRLPRLPRVPWRLDTAFDAVSSLINQTTTTPSWSHTCTGTNLVLVVTVGWRVQDAGNTITGITYNGVALTQHGVAANSTFARAEIWYLINPATGAHTIAATFTDLARAHLGGLSFSGVDQTTPLGTFATNTGASGAPTATVASATGHIVVGVVAQRGVETFTSGADQTMRWQADAANNVSAQCDTKAGAASVAMAWTADDTQEWAVGGASVQAVAGAAASLPYQPWMHRGPVLAQ